MRMSVALSLAMALAAGVVGSSGAAFATSRTSPPVVRDHRTPAPAPVVRDHRATSAASKAISVQPQGRKVIRPGRNYDKVPNRTQAVVNGKRVPVRVVR
jgi:hypothetical protein